MLRKAIMLSAILGLLMGCSPGGPYAKKDGKWYFEKTEMAVPAGETLTPLNRRFAKSKTMAFFRESPIPGADVASFEALSEHYARDRTHVWWGDTYREGQEYFLIVHTRITELEGADPASFVALDQDYGRDRSRVWYEGKPFTAEAATFEVLDYGYARDSASGYYMRSPIPGSDGKTFSVIDDNWSKDAGRVFWSDIDLNPSPPQLVNRIVGGADPKTFQALEGDYAKDAAHVWFEGQVVEGADPATFVVGAQPDGGDAKDRSGSWKGGATLAAANAQAAAAAAAEAEPAADVETEAAEPAETTPGKN